MKFSIITATYNSVAFIESSLMSVLNQSINDVEIIIVDGLSNDGTIKKIEHLVRKHQDIKLICEADNGIYDALNKGIDIASGEIIGFVHSDDMLSNNNVLDDIRNVFIKQNVDGVYGDLEYVDKLNTNKIIRYWKSCQFSRSLLKKGWSPPHPSLFLKKSVYEKHGNFNLNYTISSDYDFMIRVLKDERLCFSYLPQVITKMRVGGISNKNLKSISTKSYEDYKVIKDHQIGGLITLVRKNSSKIKQFMT